MNFEKKILLCKLYKHKKSKEMLSLNFDKDTIDMNNIERDMKLYVGRG
jgi:hypothetical protein